MPSVRLRGRRHAAATEADMQGGIARPSGLFGGAMPQSAEVQATDAPGLRSPPLSLADLPLTSAA